MYYLPSSQKGNVVIALFGAVAAVGVLAIGMQNLIKGPMTTMSKVTRVTMAENQMMAAAQMAAVTSTTQASNGDCDSDTYVEPLPWLDASGDGPDGVATSDGGGFLPLTIGAMKKDPWNTSYGYCVWDHGSAVDNAGCGGGTQLRLQGTNASSWSSIVIISAGPDKIFQTACRDWVDGNADNEPDDALYEKTAGSDDVIFAQTYAEASASVGGLWALKSGDPGTATISKDIEVTGGGTFTDSLSITAGGLLLPDQTASGACGAANDQQLRRNTGSAPPALEICYDSDPGAGTTWTWEAISGGGGGPAESLVDDTVTTCDGTTVGSVRYNSSTDTPEYCDGTLWRAFRIVVPVANLTISPTSATSMNIDGGAACGGGPTCYSSNQTFTITNSGTATSESMTTALSNTTNFEFVSDTCTGNTLAVSATCSIVVRALATDNTTYSGTLTVTADNDPFVNVSGTATNFGCYAGKSGGGGVYVSCNNASAQGTYDLVAMPGGCSNTTTNPTCSGTDSVTKQWSSEAVDLGTRMSTDGNGAQATINLGQIKGSYALYAAINHCDAMTYGGYSDWFLPSAQELRVMYANRSAIGGFAAGHYASSIQGSPASTYQSLILFTNGSTVDGNKTSSYYVRCVRRHDVALPPAQEDDDPSSLTFAPQTTTVSGTRLTSAALTIAGIDASPNTATITLTGSDGTPRYTVNGGAETASGGTITNGDVLRIVMDAPTTVGTQNYVTVTIGSTSTTYYTRYIATQTARVFVTASAYTPSGSWSPIGLTGADNLCRSEATSAGFHTNWKALLSGRFSNVAQDALTRTPWNWTTLQNMRPAGSGGPQTIATSITDLFDGTISATIDWDATGTQRTAASVWTGTTSAGFFDTTSGGGVSNCDPAVGGTSWATGIAGYATTGSTSATNSGWIATATNASCTVSRRLYCVEDLSAEAIDTTPGTYTFNHKSAATSTSAVTSDVVTISGLSTSVSVVITGSSGSPGFKINGGATVTSGTVVNGDTVQLVMDAPGTVGTYNSMTATVGTGSTVTWRVWAKPGDGTKKRIFVTSTSYTPGSGGFVGVGTADGFCSTRATAGSLTGTWKAILSGSSTPNYAINRLLLNFDSLVLVDGTASGTTGTTVVSDPATLFDSTLTNQLAAAISKNELNAAVGSVTPNTGTYANGTGGGTDSTTCNDWSSATPSGAIIGSTSVTTSSWTASSTGQACSTARRLFCLEQ